MVADSLLTLRDLVNGEYGNLETFEDLRTVLRSGNDINDVMTRLNPTYWMPAVRVLGMHKIPDMLIVMSISLAGLLTGCVLMYLVLRFCLGSPKHPRLRMATHTRSNAVHVIALSLKILAILAGFFIALGSVGIDPINVALSLGVAGLFITVAFQRVGIQVAATYTLTGGGLLAEGMEVVVLTRIGIVRAEVVAIGTYNTMLQGVLVGGIATALDLGKGDLMIFYIPNSDFVDGSWGRLPNDEDDITTTGEGKPNAPPTLPGPVGVAVPYEEGMIGQLVRTVTGKGTPTAIKRMYKAQ